MFVVPNQHKSTPFELNENEFLELRDLLLEAKSQMQNTLNCDAYTIYWNVGEAAGQGLEHVHLHIVPRYTQEPYAGKGPGFWIKSEENRCN